MLVKNKKLMLVVLLVAISCAQPAQGITSWFSSALASAQSFLMRTLNTAQEYKKSTAALMGLTIGASLISFCAWHMKKQQRADQELLDDENWNHGRQKNEDAHLKKETRKKEQSLKQSADCLNNKKQQLRTLEQRLEAREQERKQRNDQAAQQEEIASLNIEVERLKKSIKKADKQYWIIVENNNEIHVHNKLDYWLAQSNSKQNE